MAKARSWPDQAKAGALHTCREPLTEQPLGIFAESPC